MLRRISVIALLLLAVGAGRGQTTSLAKELTGQPVPNAVEQSRARQMIRKIFAAEYGRTAAADRQALARTLLAQGVATRDDLAARYVALADAADLAAGVGDAVTAVAAASELAKTFAVQGLELRRTVLMKAHTGASTAAESEAVMRLALETADQAVVVDAFDAVEQMSNLAEAAANKTRQVRVVASIQVRLGMLRELTAEFAQVKQAYARLAKNDADAEAHLVIGKFYALHKGQWAVGLPHLAAGSDAELSALAAKELAKPADGLAQAALGDAWWEYAEKSSGLTRSVVNAHATEWYRTAQATIQGITLARIQSRISGSESTPAFSSSLGVDLLGLIDVQKDGAQGSWTRGADGVMCGSSAYACLRLPYEAPEEYDLKAAFTRTQGKGQIALLLAANKKAFGFALDISGEARFEMVNGKAAKDNPTVVPVAVSNEHRYTLTVEVRKAQVRALLDGKELAAWKTDYKDLSRYTVWKLGDNAMCGIGAHNAAVTFHAVELVEVTGKGKGAR
jgi:hypothetical protein